MIINCPEDLKEAKGNLIEIEEDNIELYVNTIELFEEYAHFKGIAIIDEEKYHDFTVEVTFLNSPKDKDFISLLNEEWDCYDLIF